MQVIPVIDIRHGAVVRAIAGRRDEYAPIETPLAPSCAPLDVACGLMALHSFETLYIADLDAIEARGENSGAIVRICEAFPKLRLWVDAGIRSLDEARDRAQSPCVDPVIGSENCADVASLEPLRNDSRVILSLDYLGERFLGNPLLQDCDAFWPERVIVMTLARVGAGAGPDVARVAAFAKRAKGRRVYAAGGVRGMEDLHALKVAGAAGALVATALHDGRLTREDLLRLAQK
ncbi:HisA/HisF-related TIM barrel protein [Methylocystis parvus]|uniref:HisA/HisF-related TIM barrel protein n=1 Tax=Methylocystis parvus TaxID=134 RepID=UPI003C73AC0A